MKKAVLGIISVFIIVSIFITGCNTPTNDEVTSSTDSQNDSSVKVDEQSSLSESTEIKFSDPAFEQVIRSIVGKQTEPITPKDVEEITILDLPSCCYSYQATGEYKPMENSFMYFLNKREAIPFLSDDNVNEIKTLVDMKYLVGLEVLCLGKSKNLDFVKYLPNLKYLQIDDCPHDLSPLSYCQSLQFLAMDFKQVTDFSPLSKLKNIKEVYVNRKFQEDDGINQKISEQLPNTIVVDFTNADEKLPKE